MEPHVPMTNHALHRLPYLVAVAFFMQMLDSTIVNTALPSIAKSLNTDPLSLHSIIVSYMVTVAVLIPASGWIADKLGSGRTFIAAIAIFTLGSLCCALSTTVTLLTLSRILQGIGAAFLMPIGRLTILRTYPRALLVKVMNLVTIPGLIGPLLGPTLGGFLSQNFSWHWIFLINLPIGLAGIIAAKRWMPNFFGVETIRFDWKGFCLFSSAAVCCALSLDTDSNGHISIDHMIGFGSVGVMLWGAYWFYARVKTGALFNLRLFKTRHFTIGIAGNLISRLGTGALPYMIPLFLQVVLGYSAFKSGLSMLPLAAAGILGKFAIPPLLERWGYRSMMIINTVCIGLFMASMAFITTSTNPWIMYGLLACLGAVNSMQFTCMNTLTLIDLPTRDASSGNAMLAVVMQLSMSLGIGLAALMIDLLSPEQSLTTPTQLQSTFHITFVVVGIASMLSSIVFTRVGAEKGRNPKKRKSFL